MDMLISFVEESHCIWESLILMKVCHYTYNSFCLYSGTAEGSRRVKRTACGGGEGERVGGGENKTVGGLADI